MRRWVISGVLAAFVVLSATTISASSQPTLSGVAAGIELCPKFICGLAIFVGEFQGEVNGQSAGGWFSSFVDHQNLPQVGQLSLITGGKWTIGTNRGFFKGRIAGGTLYNLDGTLFCVTIVMPIVWGGDGVVYFSGFLDHGPLPTGLPTIAGEVLQALPSSLCPPLP